MKQPPGDKLGERIYRDQQHIKNFNNAQTVLQIFSHQCNVIGPFYLWKPRNTTRLQVKFELQANVEGLHLAYIQSLIKHRGYGAKAMKVLCALADQHECPIHLEVETNEAKVLQHISKARKLFKFYKQFGFVSDSGHKLLMRREPQQP